MNTISEVTQKIIADNRVSDMLLNTEEYPIPASFCFNRKNVRAIVLGADPSNFSEKKKTVKLSTAFGIGSGNSAYFGGIFENLNLVGIGLHEIYVQNLVPNYMSAGTGNNKSWSIFADHWVDHIRNEFDAIDKSHKTPVLLTAELLYKYLLNAKVTRFSATQIYSRNGNATIPIPGSDNKLKRPLIPFYRFDRGDKSYHLRNPKWDSYKEFLKTYFKIEN